MPRFDADDVLSFFKNWFNDYGGHFTFLAPFPKRATRPSLMITSLSNFNLNRTRSQSEEWGLDKTKWQPQVVLTATTKGTSNRTLKNNGLSCRIQSLHVGMQPPVHFSAVVFRNRTWKPQFSCFVENVNVRVEYKSFQSSYSFKNKASKFSYSLTCEQAHLRENWGKGKKRREGKERENPFLSPSPPPSPFFLFSPILAQMSLFAGYIFIHIQAETHEIYKQEKGKRKVKI